MSNTSEYDGDFYDWFAKLLISQGCPEDKARECVESMKEPRKRTLGDLTLREAWDICDKHFEAGCNKCPLFGDTCVGGAWPKPKEIVDREVDL